MKETQRPLLSNNPLLRFFEKEDYALQALAGSLRFGVLEYYRTIEDARKDSTEGQSSVYFPGRDVPIHSTVTSLNRYYILCATHPEVDVVALAKKYGRFMVRINEPNVLLERIKAAWQVHPLAQNDGAFVAWVEYTKDEMRETDPYFLSPPHLVYCQKRREDEVDREFRYLLKTKVDTKRTWNSHLVLRVPDCRDICSGITEVILGH
jgi:hypothetical protein